MTSGAWVGTAASWMLTYLIHSTILILAVWLVVRGIKPLASRIRPSAENLAWKLALVGAFVTATVQVGAGVRPALGALELVSQAPATAAAPAVAAPAAASSSTITVAPQPSSAPVFVARAPAAAPEPARPEPAPLWPKLLLLAWAIGAGLMLVRLTLAAWTLRRRLRDRGPVLEDPVLESFLTLCRDAEIGRAIKLTQSARIVSPIALWRREIVVPERAVAELPPAAMRSVLAHELAHLQRRDPHWLAVAATIEALCFFQPLNWLARRGMQESAELLCDDWAIARTGDGITFAKSLAEVASWEQANRSSVLLAGMVSGDKPLVRRVRRALDGDPGRFESDTSPRPARMLAGLGSLAALILIAPGAVDASPPQAGDRAAGESMTDPAQLQAQTQQQARDRAAEAKARAEAAQREADRLAAEARAAAQEAERAAGGSSGPHLILRDGDEYLRVDQNGVTLRSNGADIDIVDDGQNPKLRMRVREGGSELDLDVDLRTLERLAMGLLGDELLGSPTAPPSAGAGGPTGYGVPSNFGGGFGGGLDELDALEALEALGGLGGFEGLGGFDEQAIERELEAIERELEQELLRELGEGFGGLLPGLPAQPSAPPAPSRPAAPASPPPASMPSVAPQAPAEPGQPSPLSLI